MARLGMGITLWAVSVTRVGGSGWMMERLSWLNGSAPLVNTADAHPVMTPPPLVLTRLIASGSAKWKEAGLEDLAIYVTTSALVEGGVITRPGSANASQELRDPTVGDSSIRQDTTGTSVIYNGVRYGCEHRPGAVLPPS
jgi:hypothetical protein